MLADRIRPVRVFFANAMRLLFRPEAVEAQRQQWLGRVRLVQPLPLIGAAGGAVLLVVALLVFASVAPYTRLLRAEGVLLDPGLAEIGVPAAAVASLQPGLPARLHFEALPAQPGGHVSATVERGSRTPGVDGRYAVTLRLAPGRADLETGMRLSAVVEIQRGRLVERLWQSAP